MAVRKVRNEGKWTAGFYFNNALFRTAGVYHRVLKIITGNEQQTKKRLYVDQLRPIAEIRYKQARNSFWRSNHVQRVYSEVNDLKHTPSGIIQGRDVPFEDATEAVKELLTLIEGVK